MRTSKPIDNPWYQLLASLDALEHGVAARAKRAVIENDTPPDAEIQPAVKAMRTALVAYDAIMREQEHRFQMVERLERERRTVTA